MTAGIWRHGAAVRPLGAQPQPERAGAVGRRRLAVLAPRRRHLGVRVHDDLGDPVNGRCCALPGGRRGGRRRSPSFAGVERRRRAGASAGRRSAPTLYADAVRRAATASTARASRTAGPTLHDEGAAAVDFVLRTGRMPLAAPDMQAEPRPGALHRGARSSPSSTTPARSATARTSPTSTRPPATSPRRRAVPASTARRATSRPAPGRRSAAGARRPT